MYMPKTLIASALCLSLIACSNMDTTIRKFDAQPEATPTADYELVTPMPVEAGVYKFNDLESGNVCYIAVQSGQYYNTQTALSCVQVAYIPDGTPP